MFQFSEPIGGKVVFQDILFIPYSNGKNLANPTLILEFLTGESTLCWFTCEKLPWCLAAGFVQGECFLYDKEDVIVDSPKNAEGFMVRRGKTFGTLSKTIVYYKPTIFVIEKAITFLSNCSSLHMK